MKGLALGLLIACSGTASSSDGIPASLTGATGDPARGRAIVANDPHLSLDLPATFYPIHLTTRKEGLDAIGEGQLL